jgi:hypothetical protein
MTYPYPTVEDKIKLFSDYGIDVYDVLEGEKTMTTFAI